MSPALIVSIWFTFILCGVVILIVGTLMTRQADYIADRTGWGKAFVGGILLAGATSMPEMMTEISAARMGAPNLVVGDALGSNAFNMVLLCVGDVLCVLHERHAARSGAADARADGDAWQCADDGRVDERRLSRRAAAEVRASGRRAAGRVKGRASCQLAPQRGERWA